VPHFIGIDVGTTGSKVLVIDEEGRVKGSYTVEYPLYTPKPGLNNIQKTGGGQLLKPLRWLLRNLG